MPEGDGLTCDAQIWPSWASRWHRCGSRIGADGRCLQYRHESPLGREERLNLRAAHLGEQMSAIWAGGLPIGEDGRIDWTRFARELLDRGIRLT
jgi:hypothetical protein